MVRKAGVILVILLVFTSLGAGALAQDAACDEAQVRANIQRVIAEGFNQGNTTVIDELFAEDYVGHPDDLDRAAFGGQMQALRMAMPSGEAHIEHLLVEGCNAFFLFHQHGLFEGELTFPGEDPITPTGRDLDLDVHVYLRLNEAGQVIEEWDFANNLSYLTQAGVFPAPEGAEPMAEATDEPTAEATMEAPIAIGGNEARNTDVARQAFEEGFNAGNMELLRGLYSPDFMGHSVSGAPQTADDLFGLLNALRSGLPDAQITLNGSVAQGDYVASRVTLTGTFTSALAIPNSQVIDPTNQPLTLEFSFLHRLTPEGLIVEDWQAYDQLDLLTQTGVINMEATAEATMEAGSEATAEATEDTGS